MRALATSSRLLENLETRVDNSFQRELAPDPENGRYFPNQTMRAVMSGHYVNVKPAPLQNPYLVSYSSDMLCRLGLPDDGGMGSDAVVAMLAGDAEKLRPALQQSIKPWATPYAVSVYGQPIQSPCQFRGYGYGDGRAISLLEIMPNNSGEGLKDWENGNHPPRWELQLKGGGSTPFCRGADGRAVVFWIRHPHLLAWTNMVL